MRTYNIILKYIEERNKYKKTTAFKVVGYILLGLMVVASLVLFLCALGLFKLKLLIVGLLVLFSVAVMITISVMEAVYNKKERDKCNERLLEEFTCLESVIKNYFFGKNLGLKECNGDSQESSEIHEKNNCSNDKKVVGDLPISVIDELIDIFDKETKSKDNNIRNMSVIIGGFVSSAIALANLFRTEIKVDIPEESIGTYLDIMTATSVIVLAIIILGGLALYITYEIKKNCEKIWDYKWFLELLKHYKVYLVGVKDAKKDVSKNDSQMKIEKKDAKNNQEKKDVILVSGVFRNGKKVRFKGAMKIGK